MLRIVRHLESGHLLRGVRVAPEADRMVARARDVERPAPGAVLEGPAFGCRHREGVDRLAQRVDARLREAEGHARELLGRGRDVVVDRRGVAGGEAPVGGRRDERPRLRLARRACGHDRDRLALAERQGGDHRVDHGTGILRLRKPQGQRVVRSGQHAVGGGIRGVHGQPSGDGRREGQRDLRNRFSEVVARDGDFQYVDFVCELQVDDVRIVADAVRILLVVFAQRPGALDRRGHHHVPLAVERSVLHGRNVVTGPQSVGRGRDGRDGIIGIGIFGHGSDAAPEAGAVVGRVVVVERECGSVEHCFRRGVPGPERQPVSLLPADLLTAFVQRGARGRTGPDVESCSRTYRYFEGACCRDCSVLRIFGACGEEQRQEKQGCPTFHHARILLSESLQK